MQRNVQQDAEDESMAETPIVVRALGDKVQRWEGRGDMIYIFPKKASFDEMTIRTLPIFLGFENKLEFTGYAEIVSEEKMTETDYKLFRILKTLECELEWQRKLFRKALFVPFSGLQRLQSSIPDIKPDPTLSNALNSDRKLMSEINSARPDELYIYLHSIPFPPADPKDEMQAIEQFFYNPKYVLWATSLTWMISRDLAYKRNVIKVFEILDMTISAVKMVSDKIKSKI